ncbi:MAG: glutathione S-transferase N-terminal domain-containing protein [Hyphomicrobiales bacterium]|nr:glutathione S-transferase N-terminal domain-containing protein [Hyphomicrobiales bacterium]
MIDFYAWYTSNARKVAIMLEETGVAYTTHIIDIGRGDQFKPEFLALSPNNRIPAIVDRDGPAGRPLPVFESGAILVYLAEKTGRFLPADGAARYDAMQWLMFQMSGVGPMFGQYNHFSRYAREKIPYAIGRYARECGRLYWVMERRLGDRDYIAGDYSIADMALFPWARTFDWREQDPDEVPHVKAWVERIEARPAVAKALEALAKSPRSGPIDDRHWENMYGDTQYQPR